MVKTTITDVACETAKLIAGPDTVIVTLQNGLGNEEVLKKYFPPGAYFSAAATWAPSCPSRASASASRARAWRTSTSGPCEMNDVTRAAGEYLEKCFAAGGAKPQVLRRRARAHLEKGHQQQRLQHGLRRAEAEDTRGVRHAGGREAGPGTSGRRPATWPLRWASPASGSTCRRRCRAWFKGLGDYYPSMAQDCQKHRQTEVDSLTRAISMLIDIRIGRPPAT